MAADSYIVCVLAVICLITGISRANENAPGFIGGTTRTSISEGTEIGMVVFSDIIIQDPDSDNPFLNVVCAQQEREYDACDYFELEPTIVATTQEWRGLIKLKQQLDYEAYNIYEVTIAADDSVFTQYQTYTVDVTNIQDVRPVFSGSFTGTVREDAAVGTPVLQMTATDGDNLGAAIRYILIDQEGYFQIGFESGVISTAAALDRENMPGLTEGRVTLEVQASELLANGTLGSGESYSRKAEVQISVTDVNDNAPVFSPEQHTIIMDENLADEAAIPDLNIRVVDYDQGANAAFRLRLLDYTDIFDIQPNEGRGSLAASIIIKDSSQIDYDYGQRQYILQIVAEENGGSGRQNTGQVTINVEDINDYHPVFEQPFYTATVQETAVKPDEVLTVKATDLDQTDYYGGKSIRYKLLGAGSNQFNVHRVTGKITVDRARGCYDPGVANCLDADVQNYYSLFVSATDAYAEGHDTIVPLNITIVDVNDNRPQMLVPNYVSYIVEEETIPDPEITVEAEDGDRPDGLYSSITYTIVGGQPTPSGLWSINSQTGYVQATRGVPYPPGGRYVLTVEASDNNGLSDTATVTIIVEDINNHSPVFDQDGLFVESIPEDTPPGTVVVTVTAWDNDPADTPNGQLQYRIIEGARGKFNLDESTGVFTVAPGATFDYDLQNMYNITVIGEDQGNPKRSSQATIIVHILDANNKNPVFRPTTFRMDVLESAPVGNPVVTVTAQDLDKDADLVYSIIGPYRVWDTVNREITDNQEFQDWFAIVPSTGQVTVNDKLDRDRVIRWSASIKVQDVNGGPEQTATGLLIINIIEVNERPPIFAPPWTPENPIIDINVREGQAAGSYITTLIASDPSNGIDKFVLFSNPGGYFDVDEKTGVVTVAKPLDYETMRSTQYVVVAIDNGQPPLTSTATVNVEIINVNDETPSFSLKQYEKSIPENSPEGFSVVQVVATDDDIGDYGVIRYKIDDPDNNFVIDQISGWITVAPGAVLDREQQRLIVVTAQAYDSPADEDVRKLVSAPVYITLTDVDEFPPKFSRVIYNVVIPETSPADSSVIRLTASDEDDSDKGFSFLEIGGDPNDLFYVDPKTGLVTTRRLLEDRAGVYNMSVLVRNEDGGPNTNTAYIEITVLEMDNRPPLWIFPNPTNQTVEIMENEPVGTIVVKVTAQDSDAGINGIVDYSFDVNGEMVNKTEDFSINGLTGVIAALRSFDREKKDVYILSLIARDRGLPFGEAKQTLVIRVLDVEDNRPQFPMHRNCCTISFYMDISELSPPDASVARIQAKDKDIGESARIIYSIESVNEEGTFEINSETGEIHLINNVDHERTDKYVLLIKASNPLPGPSSGNVGSQCAANCTDSSMVYLYINILDHNELPPHFSHQTFNACVSAKARFDTVVTKLSAIDPDKKSSDGVTYKLDNLDLIPTANRQFSPESFIVHDKTGVVTTNALMEMYAEVESYFKLKIRASDANSSTQAALRIFVTSSDKEVVITMNQPKEDVENDLDAQIKVISEATGYSIVCINSIRVHVDVDGGGTVDVTRTDLYLHVIDPNSLLIVDPDIVRARLVGVTGAVVMASASQWTGFIRDPVLIAIIVVAVLLFIALLLLCCLCWCWSAIFKKRQKYVEAPIVLNAGTINPLWKGFEVQELSMAVPEAEAKLRAMSGFANVGYDQTDATMQKTQMSNGYMATHEEIHMTESALSGPSTRIEADLLHNAASNTMMAGSSSLGMGTITQGVQTDDMASALNISTEYLVPGSPSRIGATLTRNEWQGQYNAGYDYDMDTDAYMTNDGRSVGIQTFHASRTYTQDYHDEGAYPSGPEVDNDYPDSFYQGEIHLGSLPPRSTTYNQTQYTASTQEYHNSNTYEADGEIEYITF